LRTAAILVVSTMALAVAGAVHADIYDFSFTGAGVSGSGDFVTATGASPWTVTSATGTIFDSNVAAGPFTITGLSSYAGADNLLYASQPYVDFGGISVTTDTGGDFNFGLGGGGAYGLVLNDSVNNSGGYPNGGTDNAGSTDISWTVTRVPEPATWALMIMGFAGLGAALRRRVVAAAV
jgi:hypothetical protein